MVLQTDMPDLPVGNAKVAGMAKDLHLVGLRYNIAAAVFFVSRVRGIVVVFSLIAQ